MKTLKMNGEIKRATDQDASKLVKQGWVYCPKSEWKATVKPELAPTVEDASAVVPVDTISKKQKRKNEKLVEKLVGTEPKKKGKKDKQA